MARFAPLARLPRPARWAVRILVLLLVLALLLSVWIVWTIRRSFPELNGKATLAGLSKDVTVQRDKWGIPQLYGDDAGDLLRAQGYVHAQDRFWEMDFRRHVTAGRLSELFGKTTLDTDKAVRTMGWRRVAQQELNLVGPQTRSYLEAYAQGVNAWLKAHKDTSTQSLEYAVLGFQRTGYNPEPWTPLDSLSWLKAMAWDLRSNMEDELGRARAATKVSKPRVEQLYPPYDYKRFPTIVTTPGPDTKPEGQTVPASLRNADRALAGVSQAIGAMPEMLGNGKPGIGSNSWVVAGSRTTTGKPFLANDPHLAPHMPSIWYQVGLHCRKLSSACPIDVSGFSFSGVPGVVIGHNNRIAWGFTNLGPDVSDLYLERVSGQTYEYKGVQVPLESRIEEIKVAGSATVKLSVRATRHGPIISDVMDEVKKAEPGTAVALRWTALDPGRTGDAIMAMNIAQNWKEFRAAAKSFEVPAQNLVYADVDGNIGYQAPGRIPVRTKGDGTWPVEGWTGDFEWKGYLPYEQLPTVSNPKAGYIVTANNAAIGPQYKPLLTKDWSYGYRAQRIDDLVSGTAKMDVPGMGRVQMDSRNGFAPTLVPQLQRVGGPDIELLQSWDFTQPRESAPAAYYNAVWRHLLLRTFNDELPEDTRPDGGDRWFEAVRGLLDEPDDAWWDDVRTPGVRETRDDMLRQAIKDGDKELRDKLGKKPQNWHWGDLHTLELTNDTFGTSGIGPIEWMFNRGPIKLAGGPSIVDAAGWDAQEGYKVNSVPSMRMVIDLADLNRSRWINLTGASGHAFHGNYDDQSEPWSDGQTIPMRSGVEHTLVLKP